MHRHQQVNVFHMIVFHQILTMIKVQFKCYQTNNAIQCEGKAKFLTSLQLCMKLDGNSYAMPYAGAAVQMSHQTLNLELCSIYI